jgi:uncharacterized membrane protein
MAWWLWVLIGLAVLTSLVFVISIFGAREGYEDEEGNFHWGKEK